MEATTTTQPQPQWQLAVRTYLRGAGQVMFQQSAWSGLFIVAGIFVGAYMSHTPAVAWGALVGLLMSTLAGYLLHEPDADGDAGLWGFNGILVGCAFPTFLGNTWLMWMCLILFAMLTTWVRRAFNNVMAPWKVNSLTFPFVFLTWVMLYAARIMGGIEVTGLSDPTLPPAVTGTLDCSFGHLVEYWLRGVSQVFLINSWITGVLFLVGLFLCNRWAAIWAAIGSALSLAVAILMGCNPSDIANGLFGFSPVLTGIALGMTFYAVNWRSAVWAIIGIVATVFIQAAMDVFFDPWGLPTLTGPFCITTWLFLLPQYKFGSSDIPSPEWRAKVSDIQRDVDRLLHRDADEIEKKI